MRILRVLLSVVLLAVQHGYAQPRGTIGCSWSPSAYEAALPSLSATTGNATLDAQLNREYQMLSDFFGVRPTFYIYDDSGAPNAIAFPPQYQPGFSGAVIFGINLMRDELTDQPENISIPAIMAHEFGHIVQYNAGCDLPVRSRELQADYLAGSYMKHRFQAAWNLDVIAQTAKSFYSKGDYQFNDPQHHGTPGQRWMMVNMGFNNMDTTIAEHYARSYSLARLYDQYSPPGADLADLPPEWVTPPVQPAQPTRPSTPAGSSSGLDATLKVIRDGIGSIGRVEYTTSVHDDNSGEDSTVAWMWERSNVRVSAANCRFDSHTTQARNGVATTNQESWFLFRGVESVEVLPIEEVLQEAISDKPELTGLRVEPAVFVIRVTGPNFKQEIALFDESLANRIAKALTRAAALCGANQPK